MSASLLVEPRPDLCPFRSGEWYEIGELRRVAAEIQSSRQANPSLSAMMRVETEAKSWNEELHPFKVFADHKALGDDDQFCWTPNDSADFSIRPTGGGAIKIQITMAYPEWPASVGKQGGHTHKLEMEQSNEHGFSFLGGLVSEPRARSPYDDLEACRVGIAKALTKKLKPGYEGCYLLIFADRCTYLTSQLTHELDFRQVVTPAIEQAGKGEWERMFEGLYVCDDHSFVEIKRSAKTAA